MHSGTAFQQRFLRAYDGASALQLSLIIGGLLAGLGALYIVLVPSFHLLPDAGLYNGKRLLQVALLLGFGSWLMGLKQARTRWLQTLETLPFTTRLGLAIILFLGALSAAQAAVPHYAWLELSHMALLFAVVVAVAGVYRHASHHASKVIVAVVALSTFVYAITFGVGYGGYLAGQFSLWPNAFAGFSNIRFFNHYQTWTLPLLAVAPMLLADRSRFLRAVLFGLLTLWWTLLFASGGRGTLVATLVAAGAVGFLYREAAKSWLKHQFAALCCGGGLFLLLFKVMTTTQSSLADRTMVETGGRLEAWKDALEMAAQSPILGTGPMHYAYYPAGSIWSSPHSAPLQFLAEWGAPVTMLVLALVGWGFWAWICQSRRRLQTGLEAQECVVRVAITAALLAGAMHSLVSGVIIAPLSQILMAVTVGWAWGLYVKHKPTTSPSQVSNRLLQGGLALALCAVVWGGVQDISALGKRPQAYHEVSGSLVLYPRYWQQGYFGLGIDIEEIDAKSRTVGIVGKQ